MGRNSEEMVGATKVAPHRLEKAPVEPSLAKRLLAGGQACRARNPLTHGTIIIVAIETNCVLPWICPHVHGRYAGF